MSQHNQSKFAKLAGVSKVAISNAIKRGKLVLNESKKIDDNNPLAIKYLRNQLEKSKKSLVRDQVNKERSKEKPKRKEKQEKYKEIAKELKKIIPPEEKKIIDNLFKSKPELLVPMLESAKKIKNEKQKQPEKIKQPEIKSISSQIDDETVNGFFEKETVEIEYKKANTEKVKIANAEKLKLLVPVDVVQKKFGKISSVILNFFFPLGDRLAPVICGECGITDPKIIKKVKSKIDNEVTRSLSEFKKVAAEEVGE